MIINICKNLIFDTFFEMINICKFDFKYILCVIINI